jgi:CRISPR-associated endonuclease/helicase Cas3
LKGLWAFIENKNLGWQHTALGIGEEADATEPTTATVGSSEVGRSTELQDARELLISTARQVRMVRYPGGIALTGPRISRREALPRASFDDDFDEHNVDADGRIPLVDHLADVAIATEQLVSNISLDPVLANALVAAAERHDLGKADLRFQAMLLASSLDMAAMQPKLWAKSACGAPVPQGADGSSRRNASADQLPYGFRHEMLSLELARQIHDDLDPGAREVMLHAIAAHHGHARPFAPVVIDDTPPDVDLCKLFPDGSPELNVLLTAEERRHIPPHRLDSGISERF